MLAINTNTALGYFSSSTKTPRRNPVNNSCEKAIYNPENSSAATMFRSHLDLPRRAHRLLDVRIRVLVIDEPLLLRVKSQRTARLDRDLGQIDQRAGAMTV